MLETIKINTSGYEFREGIEDFVDKFWPIAVKKVKSDQLDQLENTAGHMPGSLEDYVHKIFTVAS